jgi:hypothetical protein
MDMIENSLLIEPHESRRKLLECGCQGRCRCDDDDEV